MIIDGADSVTLTAQCCQALYGPLVKLKKLIVFHNHFVFLISLIIFPVFSRVTCNEFPCCFRTLRMIRSLKTSQRLGVVVMSIQYGVAKQL